MVLCQQNGTNISLGLHSVVKWKANNAGKKTVDRDYWDIFFWWNIWNVNTHVSVQNNRNKKTHTHTIHIRTHSLKVLKIKSHSNWWWSVWILPIKPFHSVIFTGLIDCSNENDIGITVERRGKKIYAFSNKRSKQLCVRKKPMKNLM